MTTTTVRVGAMDAEVLVTPSVKCVEYTWKLWKLNEREHVISFHK